MSGTLNFAAAVGAIANLGRSNPVILGTVSLTGMEVPDMMRVGGQQRLAIHNLPGGEKLIDVVGNDDARLELSGRFVGSSALERAQAVEAIRNQGRPVIFSVAGLSWRVFVFDYAYDYSAKGAVIGYRLTLERQEKPGNRGIATSKSLSGLVGDDIGNAISGLTTAVSNVATTAADATGQLQTVIGQVTPIANIVGLGGPLAAATNDLQAAQAITQVGTDLGTAPTGLATLQGNLAAAGSSLMTTIEQTGANLDSISFDGSAASLNALAQNAQIQSVAADAGALINRANRNVTTAGGGTQADPLVHS